mgnify:CR=1 FL=1
MPEWGMPPIPKKLLQQCVLNKALLSDARLSRHHLGSPYSALRAGIVYLQSANGGKVRRQIHKKDATFKAAAIGKLLAGTCCNVVCFMLPVTISEA